MVIGLLCILEWILKIQFITKIYHINLPTSPDTAFTIILFSVFLHFNKLLHSQAFRIILAAVSTLGLFHLAEYFLNIEITAGSMSYKIEGYPAWQTSPVTGSLSFITGFTLFFSPYLLKTSKRRKILFYLGLLISFCGFVIMTGYFYRTPFLYGSEMIPVAFTTSVSFFLLGYQIRLMAGNVFFRDNAIVSKVTSGMIRAILPVVAGSIFLEGLVMEQMSRNFNINHALYISGAVLVLIILIYFTIFQISKVMLKSAIQAETDLKKEYHFRQLLLDNMVEGVIACDKDGTITLTNKVICEWLGYDLAGQKLGHPYANLELFSNNEINRLGPDQTPLYRAFHGEQLNNIGMLLKGKQVKYAHVSGAPLYDDKNEQYGAVVTLHDITEGKEQQKERAITLNLLELLNRSNNLIELIRLVTYFIKELTKCDAAGIRFRENEDFPYYETIGFNAQFVKNEKYLCAWDKNNNILTDKYGNPWLRCMCGKVLSGQVDSSESFFTTNGSFHLDSTSQLYNEEQQSQYCTGCQTEGYESVALIPLRVAGETIGLIQLNDKRKNHFSRSIITFLEQLSSYIAIALLQRRTKAELRESEEKYRSLAETTDDYIIRFDEHCRPLYLNPPVLKLLGTNLQDILGKTFAEAGFHGETVIFFEEKIREVLVSGNSRHSQVRLKIKQNPLYLDWKLKPEFDSQGKIKSVLGVARDITILKKIEEDLIGAKEKAEQNDNLKSAFLANMSHEIRTPMNAILGFSELMLNTDVSDAIYKQYSEIIHMRSKYLLGLIEDILDLSKVEAGILNIRNESFDLNLLFDEIAAQTKMKLGKINRNLELKFIKGRPDGDSIICSDQKRLQQILINLIDNAIKFTKEGSITIRYFSQRGKGLIFSVSDTGTGISEDKRQLIFERFHRSTDMNNNGLGLGLSICRGLVKLLGGKIWIESEINKGSVFSFNIPVDFQEETDLPKEEAAGRISSVKPKVKVPVLVVDDDEINGEILKNILKEFDLVFATDGKSGLEEFERNPEIRLILVDIGLPDMNGKEVLRKLRQMNPAIPVFVLTAYAGDNERTECELAGCDEFLTKPIDFQLLLKKVAGYISKNN